MKGWNVVEVYHLEGVSGKAVMAHPETNRMLADVRASHITGLVFSKLARLARNTRELLDFAEMFRACGADLVSLQEAIDTSSPAGRLFFTMIAAMAQWEREEIAERVQASIPIRAKLGKPIGGAAPFGYRWHEKQLVPDPQEAPVRALLHELFAEHKRKKTVAHILNERGYRTRNGSKFSDTTISRLLLDPTAKGLHRANYTRTNDRTKSWEFKPESEWVHTGVEAIVSDELWETCERIVASQQARGKLVAKKAVQLFAGFTFCERGTKMYVRSNSPKYVCEKCRNKMPVVDLEAVYREQLHHFLVSPEEIEAHDAAAVEAMREKERLIESAQTDLRRIERDDESVFQLYLAKELSKEDFGRRHRPLSERRAQLEDELPRLQAELDILRIGTFSRREALGEARDLTDRWPDLPLQEKRQIVEAITDRIVIGKEDIEISLLYLPSGTDGKRATEPHRCVALYHAQRERVFSAGKLIPLTGGMRSSQIGSAVLFGFVQLELPEAGFSISRYVPVMARNLERVRDWNSRSRPLQG
jgi:site-specific DNA recombinase